MKKTLLFILFSIICILTGCGSKTGKMCRIEIQNADNVCIAVLEQQSQADIIAFFDEEHWEAYDDADENPAQNTLSPAYVITLYQEKTHTLTQKEETDAYEKIMEYTIYQDSDVVKETICQDTIKGGLVSEKYLTFYYIGSESFFSSVDDALK